jgi:hypothetical protein
MKKAGNITFWMNPTSFFWDERSLIVVWKKNSSSKILTPQQSRTDY